MQMTCVITVTFVLPFSFIVSCFSSHFISCFALDIISVKGIFCVKIQCLTAWDPLPGPRGVTGILITLAPFH